MEENTEHPRDLESASDRSKRIRSIRISQTSLFTSAMGFSVILTGVYPYMKQVRTNNFDLWIKYLSFTHFS